MVCDSFSGVLHRGTVPDSVSMGELMSPLILKLVPYLVSALPYLIGAGSILGAYFYVHHQGYKEGETTAQHVCEQKESARQTVEYIALAERQKKDKIQQETRNVNLTEIDRLRANNHSLWLRIPKTPCLPATNTSVEDNTAGAWELHPEIPSSAEEALNEFSNTYDGEALRADKLIEECRAISR